MRSKYKIFIQTIKSKKKILGNFFLIHQSQAGFEPTRLRAVNGSDENRLDPSTIWAHETIRLCFIFI